MKFILGMLIGILIKMIIDDFIYAPISKGDE